MESTSLIPSPQSPPPGTGRWHVDEAVVKIGGRRMYLWRAVDDEGETLDVLVQKRRNKRVALKAAATPASQHRNSSGVHRDGQARVVSSGDENPASSEPTQIWRDAGEQSGRELAPRDPTPGTKATEVQIARFSPAIPFHPRTDLQGLQSPAPSDLPTQPSRPARPCRSRMSGSDTGSVTSGK